MSTDSLRYGKGVSQKGAVNTVYVEPPEMKCCRLACLKDLKMHLNNNTGDIDCSGYEKVIVDLNIKGDKLALDFGLGSAKGPISILAHNMEILSSAKVFEVGRLFVSGDLAIAPGVKLSAISVVVDGKVESKEASMIVGTKIEVGGDVELKDTALRCETLVAKGSKTEVEAIHASKKITANNLQSPCVRAESVSLGGASNILGIDKIGSLTLETRAKAYFRPFGVANKLKSVFVGDVQHIDVLTLESESEVGGNVNVGLTHEAPKSKMKINSKDRKSNITLTSSER